MKQEGDRGPHVPQTGCLIVFTDGSFWNNSFFPHRTDPGPPHYNSPLQMLLHNEADVVGAKRQWFLLPLWTLDQSYP